MTRQPVQSSALSEVGYDPATRCLEVRFHPDRRGVSAVWVYDDVAPTTYAELMAAPSIGSAFVHIRREHSGHMVETQEKGA